MADFDDRMAELAALVGNGDLVGSVTVDQRYAKIQHEALDFKHAAGQAKYLEMPLYDEAGNYVNDLADAVLDGRLPQAMASAMEDLSGRVAKLAPIDLGNLRDSGHPVVTDGATTVYDRPPIQRRLTEQELKALKKGQNIPGI